MIRSATAVLLAFMFAGGFVPAHAGTPVASVVTDEKPSPERILDQVRAIAANQKPNLKPEEINVDKLLSAQGFYEVDLVFTVRDTEAAFQVRFYKDELGATTEELMRTLTVRKLADATARKLKRPEIRRVNLMSETPAEKGVRAILDTQVAAWNRGDLEAFMQGYWKSPELTFVSGANVTKGWDETLARYRKRYQSEGREMGTLTFDDLDIQVFTKDAAMVRGAWKLKMKDNSNPGGRFTLVFRHFKEGWRIVYDHTS